MGPRAKTVVAVLVAVVLAPACGGDDDGSSAPAKATATPAEAYVDQVQRIYDSYAAVRQDLLHGTGSVREQAETTQQALAQAASDMEAIEPPAAARQVHDTMTELYRRYADRLAAALDQDPLRAAAIRRIAIDAHEAIDRTLGDVYVTGG